MTALRLVFTKGRDKFDRLDLIRADGSRETITCPKQRIIPHDMVHYAVERELAVRGFIGRVAAGEAAGFRMEAEPESDSVERLVEVFQGDGWSGGTSDAQALRDLYAVTCDARGCPALPLDAALITAIRQRIAALTEQWDAIPVGGTLTLDFD